MLEKNIVYLLLAELNEDDDPKKLYTISLSKLKNNSKEELNYVQFRNSANKLLKRYYEIYATGNSFKKITLINSINYKKRSGEIELELSKEIRSFLFGLKNNFTIFDLKTALLLKSKYSKRFYKMLNQYKDTKVMNISISTLKKRLFLVDENGKEKYKRFDDFLKRVVNVAQKELNEKTNICFNYDTIKKGKKYTDIKFRINFNKQNDSSLLTFNKITQTNKVVKNTNNLDISSLNEEKSYKNVKLNKERYEQYDLLTNHLKWLDKNLAYKLVLNVPPHQLWNSINEIKILIQSGEIVDPKLKLLKLL